MSQEDLSLEGEESNAVRFSEVWFMNPYVQYMYSYPHKTAYRPLEGVDLQEYVELLAGKSHGL